LYQKKFVNRGSFALISRNSMQQTKKDPYPLPFIDEVLDAIVGHDINSFLNGFQRDIINP
jgi:hypothetical protein